MTTKPLYRFLQIFGDTSDFIKSRIEQIQLVWDVNKCPDKYLDYIGYLLSWDINHELEIVRQRKELKDAVRLYKRKGTKSAIDTAASNATGWEADIYSFPDHIMYSNKSEHTTPDMTDLDAMSKVGTSEDELHYTVGLYVGAKYTFGNYVLYMTTDSEFKGLSAVGLNKLSRVVYTFAPIDMYNYSIDYITEYSDDVQYTIVDDLTDTLV